MERLDRIRVLILSGMEGFGPVEGVETHLARRGAAVETVRTLRLVYRSNGTDWKAFAQLGLVGRLPMVRGIARFCRTRRFLKQRAVTYDVGHVFYNEPAYSLLMAGTLRRISKRLIVSVVGSDFLRMGATARAIQRRLYRVADHITFNNRTILAEFDAYYNRCYHSKLRLLLLGLDGLTRIDEVEAETDRSGSLRALGIDDAAFVLTCGHNGSPAQQHEEILGAVTQIRARLPEHTHLLLPMTYGCDDAYRDGIEALALQTGLPYTLFRHRMSDHEVAHLRRVTDVMIHVQKTDSLSASVQEHLFAGSVVINGGWLPYQQLRESGATFLECASTDELAQGIVAAVGLSTGFGDEKTRNRNAIREMSSWDRVIEDWCRLYAGLE
jgi:hypothetical protein